MKIKLVLLLFIGALMSCKDQNDKEVNSDSVNVSATANGEKSNTKLPVIIFEKELHDFGKITQGEKVSYSFKFKNEGQTDLLISSAKGSCGCTVPQYPKDPVKSGAEGVIDVVFDSEGKSGIVEKTVTLVTNAEPNTRVLTIKTEIVVPENK